MFQESVSIADIYVPDRLRAVNQGKVSAIRDSIDDIGLINPIVVSRTNNDEDGILELVVGAHRLEAVKALAWGQIDTLIMENKDPLLARLVEIDENLCRSELTPTERVAHIEQRQRVWEEMQDQLEVGQSFPPQDETKGEKEGQHGGARPQPKGFAAQTAEKTGGTKRAINRDLKLAKDVSEEARQIIQGTKADSFASMRRLAELEPSVQTSVARRMVQEAEASKKRQKAMSENEDVFLRHEKDELIQFLLGHEVDIHELETYAKTAECKELANICKRYQQSLKEKEENDNEALLNTETDIPD